jgi:hypothetical protein
MSSSPEQIIKAICPELSGSPSLQVYLGMAVESISRGFFGVVYNQAVAYKAAHLFTLMDSSNSGAVGELEELGGGAPVASVSEGGLSISFAQTANGSDGTALGNTKYGRMLMALMKGRPRMGVNESGLGGLLG